MEIMSKKNGVVIAIVALLVALVPIIELWHTKTVYSGADLQFHINRIHELVTQVRSGNVNFISYASFNSVGSGVQYFYPSLTLAPAILVFLLIKNSVTAYYITLGVYGIISFVIAQYSFDKLLKDKWLSICSSVIFSLSAYRVFSIIGVSAFGEFIAIAWIPLIFLGYYRIVKKEEWRTLFIAVTLMGYTHLLSLVLTVIILSMVTLVRLVLNYQKVISELGSYVKAIISFSLSFLAFLVPFLMLTKHNNIVSPDAVLHYQWAKSFAGYYVSSIHLVSTRTLGFVFLITLAGIFVMWKILSKQTRMYFWIGLGLTFIASSDFPWFMWENTAVATLQFPYRILPFAIFFLTIASVLAIKDIANNNGSQYTKKVLAVVLILITIGTTLISIHAYKKDINHTYRIETTSKGYLNYTPFATYRVTASTFDKQYNNYFNTYGAFDYWTALALKNKPTILAHKVLNDDGKQIFSKTIQGKSNISYVVNNPKQQRVDLPFLKYNGINYVVSVDGKQTNLHSSKRGTLSIEVNRGQHRIMIQTRMNKLFVMSVAISLFSIIIIMIFPYWTKRQ